MTLRPLLRLFDRLAEPRVWRVEIDDGEDRRGTYEVEARDAAGAETVARQRFYRDTCSPADASDLIVKTRRLPG